MIILYLFDFIYIFVFVLCIPLIASGRGILNSGWVKECAMRLWSWAIVLLLLAGPSVATTTLFTYRSAETALDTRNHYDMALLTLALERPAPVMAIISWCRVRP